jgi:hypothetical protein
MIKGWSQFLENFLLLESEVKYSKEFREILDKISDPVARTLSSLENKDVQTSVNFIQIIKDDPDQVTFLQDKKASKLLDELKNKIQVTWSGSGILSNSDTNQVIFDLLDYERPPSGPLPRPSSGERGEVLRDVISPKSGVSYLLVKFGEIQTVINKNNVVFLDSSQEIWNKPGKQPMRVGRVVTALLKNSPKKHTSTEIADFVSRYRTKIEELNNAFGSIEIVSGDDIAKWYRIENYESSSSRSELHNSCMARKDANIFEIYTQNPEVCSLIIQKSKTESDKITARALLWTLSDGKKFMDRVYFNNPESVELFRSYCKENGIFAKYINNNGASVYAIDPVTGSQVTLEKIEVQLRRLKYKKFPYMDTLKFYNPDNKTLDSINEDNSDYWKLESTGGGYEEGSEGCYRCGGGGYEDCPDCYSGKIDCYVCDGSGKIENENGEKVYCDECEGSGRIDCGECHGDGSVSCPECN